MFYCQVLSLDTNQVYSRRVIESVRDYVEFGIGVNEMCNILALTLEGCRKGLIYIMFPLLTSESEESFGEKVMTSVCLYGRVCMILEWVGGLVSVSVVCVRVSYK